MIGFMASQPHYLRHLAPILDELKRRGVETSKVEPGGADVMLVAGRTDVQRAARTQRPPSKLILVEHGAGQFYRHPERGTLDAGNGPPDETVTLFLSPSQRVADSMADVLPKADRVVSGSPAVERLWKRRLRDETPLDRVPVVTVHWMSPLGHLIPEAGTSWPWSKSILAAMREEWPDMIVHGHPRLQRKLHSHARSMGLRVESDWDQVALECSVLVADNTSVMWEALTVGIPVVAMTPPHWNDDAPHGFPRFGPDRFRLPTISPTFTAPYAALVDAAHDQKITDPGVYDIVDGATRTACDAILHHVA